MSFWKGKAWKQRKLVDNCMDIYFVKFENNIRTRNTLCPYFKVIKAGGLRYSFVNFL